MIDQENLLRQPSIAVCKPVGKAIYSQFCQKEYLILIYQQDLLSRPLAVVKAIRYRVSEFSGMICDQADLHGDNKSSSKSLEGTLGKAIIQSARISDCIVIRTYEGDPRSSLPGHQESLGKTIKSARIRVRYLTRAPTLTTIGTGKSMVYFVSESLNLMFDQEDVL